MHGCLLNCLLSSSNHKWNKKGGEKGKTGCFFKETPKQLWLWKHSSHGEQPACSVPCLAWHSGHLIVFSQKLPKIQWLLIFSEIGLKKKITPQKPSGFFLQLNLLRQPDPDILLQGASVTIVEEFHLAPFYLGLEQVIWSSSIAKPSSPDNCTVLRTEEQLSGKSHLCWV